MTNKHVQTCLAVAAGNTLSNTGKDGDPGQSICVKAQVLPPHQHTSTAVQTKQPHNATMHSLLPHKCNLKSALSKQPGGCSTAMLLLYPGCASWGKSVPYRMLVASLLFEVSRDGCKRWCMFKLMLALQGSVTWTCQQLVLLLLWWVRSLVLAHELLLLLY